MSFTFSGEQKSPVMYRVCTEAYIHTHINTYIHTYIHTYTHTYTENRVIIDTEIHRSERHFL
jgi:hypothetical protein